MTLAASVVCAFAAHEPLAMVQTSEPETAPVVSAPASQVAVPAVDTLMEPNCCIIPALTVVDFEILAAIESNKSFPGDKFPIRLTRPILVEGREIVPLGAAGEGEVVHANKSGFAGKPGELLLAARYVTHNGVRIPLRTFRFGASGPVGSGRDNANAALALSVVGGAVGAVASMFVTGGEVRVPIGTLANGKVATATFLRLQPSEDPGAEQTEPLDEKETYP